MRRRVALDLSQLASAPARSGVQRLLRELATRWPTDGAEAFALIAEGERLRTVPLEAVGRELAWFFDDAGTPRAERDAALRNRLIGAATGSTVAAELPRRFDAYLLPEPTYDRATLDRAGWAMANGLPVAALVMDALPALSPWLFPGDHEMLTDPYFRFVARLDHVAFISESARADFEQRLRRRPYPDARVYTPGADALAPPHGTFGTGRSFVAIGSIEPRKRVGTILDAFARARSTGLDAELLVLGVAGADHTAVRRLEDPPEWLTWIPDVTDAEVVRALATSVALVFIGVREGFGLPPLEALALGCPVISGPGVPALERLPSLGQVRLEDVTVETLSDALIRARQPAVRDALAAEIANLDLPTWAAFADGIAGWTGRLAEASRAVAR